MAYVGEKKCAHCGHKLKESVGVDKGKPTEMKSCQLHTRVLFESGEVKEHVLFPIAKVSGSKKRGGSAPFPYCNPCRSGKFKPTGIDGGVLCSAAGVYRAL